MIDSDALLNVITQSDFGWGGNILALIIILGISWRLSKRAIDILFIQFPIVLSVAILTPLFSINIIIVSLALFIINIAGSKNDQFAEVKAVPQKLRTKVIRGSQIAGDELKIAYKKSKRIIGGGIKRLSK